MYINKDLFEANHIPLPEDGISLNDILKVAARFQGTGTVGLAAFDRTNPSILASLIGESSGLRAISETNGKLTATLQTKGWVNVWTQIAQGYKDGWISGSPPLDSSKRVIYSFEMLKSDLFATGKAAMMISDVSYYASITDYENQTKKGINWSTIAYHIDPSAVNGSKYLTIPFVYAINAKTTNPEAAWELLTAILVDHKQRIDYLVVKPKIILSRPAAMKSIPEPKWQAFYNREMDPQ